MTSAWPQLEDLIRELGEVSTLPHADGEPALTDATMAVTKATTALAHAAQTRGRSSEAALTEALRVVDEARALLRQARLAIMATARHRREHAAAPAEGEARTGQVAGETETHCPGCGRAFVVRYRAAALVPRVAFPVACPVAECDGVSEVEYPSSAIDVSVELLPA
jgi:hypothetical protein